MVTAAFGVIACTGSRDAARPTAPTTGASQTRLDGSAGPAAVVFDVTVAAEGPAKSRPHTMRVTRADGPNGPQTSFEILNSRVSAMTGAGPTVRRLEVASDGTWSAVMSDGSLFQPNALATASDTGKWADQILGLARSAEASLGQRRATLNASAWIDALVQNAEFRARRAEAVTGTSRSGGALEAETQVTMTAGNDVITTMLNARNEIQEVVGVRGGREVARVTYEYTTGPGDVSVRKKAEFKLAATDGTSPRVITVTLTNIAIDGQEVK